MPAPSTATYSTAALEAANQAFADLVDSGAAGMIRIRTAEDELLAEIPLSEPCGTVSAETGRLTLSPASTASAFIAGEAAYGDICETNGTVHLSMPAVAGVAAAIGYLVLNSLVFAEGAEVSITSAVIG